MRRSLLVLAALSLAAAPAAAQDRPTFAAHGTSMYFRAEYPFARAALPYTPEQVWAALPDAYQLLGFTATPADSARRDLRTSFMHVSGQLYPGELNSQYFECSRNTPTGPAADQGDITFAMLSRVEPDGRGGSTVLTQTSARLRRRDASQYPIDCVSTGKVEQMLAQFLQQRLSAPGTVEIRRNR